MTSLTASDWKGQPDHAPSPFTLVSGKLLAMGALSVDSFLLGLYDGDERADTTSTYDFTTTRPFSTPPTRSALWTLGDQARNAHPPGSPDTASVPTIPRVDDPKIGGGGGVPDYDEPETTVGGIDCVSISAITSPQMNPSVRMEGVARLHKISQRTFGSAKVLDFGFLEENGPKSRYFLASPLPSWVYPGMRIYLRMGYPFRQTMYPHYHEAGWLYAFVQE